ncbi:uncharacterized protein LOC112558729 isoform X6 [Pomacea canaliculata]|uniref:uncharacterized protein LOC112558729 isoform X6 n=1 Tax=Pomacea canaliculata TaxID=400727 RepID=UPI000D72C2F4|nr:uncharacterized protein LOC112558729 isoform X6 [Pomacea canaliculata]
MHLCQRRYQTDSQVVQIPPDNMRFHWCRIFYRARSRSQRRRLLLWGVTLALVICLMYYNHQGLETLSQLSYNSAAGAFNAQPNELVGRQPRAVGQESAKDVAKDANNELNDGANDDDDEKSDLRSDLAPATLHFLWCGRRHFEFRHYMALRRADRLVRPDKIYFHYEHLPLIDQEGYFLWFNRTLADVDNILLKPLNYTGCPTEGAERYILVLDLLEKFGGIYIPEDAILVDFPVHLRSSSLVTGVEAVSPKDFRDGLIAGKKGAFKKPTTPEELLVVLSLGKQEHGGIQPCGSIEHYNMEEDGDCICVKITSAVYPQDIWDGKTPFATLARVAAYGYSELKKEYSLDNPIPRIAHYICIQCEVPFIAFLSMKSAVNVAGLNKVYLHGVKEPQGKWWEKLKEDSRLCLRTPRIPRSAVRQSHHDPPGGGRHHAGVHPAEVRRRLLRQQRAMD